MEQKSTIIGNSDLEAAFATFCETNGYPSDGDMDESLRKAFTAGVAYKTPESFYQMDGKPCPPDIEDELGQLLLACDKAIEFLTVGPAIEVTEDVVKAMYESNVVKLIPKLKAVLESRVSVKYPFAILVTEFAKKISEPGFKPIDHLLAATGAIEISNDRLMQNFENYAEGIDSLNVGPNTMPYLADIVIHMQRIMTTFGWTWDDVKLKARQQMAEHE